MVVIKPGMSLTVPPWVALGGECRGHKWVLFTAESLSTANSTFGLWVWNKTNTDAQSSYQGWSWEVEAGSKVSEALKGTPERMDWSFLHLVSLCLTPHGVWRLPARQPDCNLSSNRAVWASKCQFLCFVLLFPAHTKQRKSSAPWGVWQEATPAGGPAPFSVLGEPCSSYSLASPVLGGQALLVSPGGHDWLIVWVWMALPGTRQAVGQVSCRWLYSDAYGHFQILPIITSRVLVHSKESGRQSWKYKQMWEKIESEKQMLFEINYKWPELILTPIVFFLQQSTVNYTSNEDL